MLNLKIDTTQLRTTWLGRCLYYCIPNHKSVAFENIERVFHGHLSHHEKKRLLIAVYSHALTSLKEIFLMSVISDKRLKNRVEFRGLEHFIDATKKGRGVILLTGHFGNWEFAPILGLPSIDAFKGQFHFIRKSLRFHWMDNILFSRYCRRGINIIPMGGALKKARAALKKNDAVLFVLDQKANTNPNTRITSLFLGQQASTYTSLAQLANENKCAVLPVFTYRLDNKKHVIECFEEILWEDDADPAESIRKNTRHYVQQLERMLLEHPEQWIWNYKRWDN